MNTFVRINNRIYLIRIDARDTRMIAGKVIPVECLDESGFRYKKMYPFQAIEKEIANFIVTKNDSKMSYNEIPMDLDDIKNLYPVCVAALEIAKCLYQEKVKGLIQDADDMIENALFGHLVRIQYETVSGLNGLTRVVDFCQISEPVI